MSVAPLDPPGIDAAGNSRIVFVKALANPSAPTVAEIKAGTDISCAIYSFVPTFEQSTVERTKYCSKQARETLGRTKVSIEDLEYDYHPQKPDDTAYGYYTQLTSGTQGWLIDRRGLDAKTEDWAADQLVDVYPVTVGARGRVALDPNAEGEKFRVRVKGR